LALQPTCDFRETFVRYGFRCSGSHLENVEYNCYSVVFNGGGVEHLYKRRKGIILVGTSLKKRKPLSKGGSDWACNQQLLSHLGNVGQDLVHADYELDSLGLPVLIACLEDTSGADDQFAATEDAIFPETPQRYCESL